MNGHTIPGIPTAMGTEKSTNLRFCIAGTFRSKVAQQHARDHEEQDVDGEVAVQPAERLEG